MHVSPPKAAVRLPNVRPIRVFDEKLPGYWMLPGMSYSYSIPTIWSALELSVDDWINAAESNRFDKSLEEDAAMEQQFLIFDRLLPRYILCLFSYTHNFFLLENGYQILFDEIKRIPMEFGERLKVPKRPKRPEYIERLRLVRNKTMTHWGGPDDRHHIDSRAGRQWGFSTPSADDSLRRTAFGYESAIGASPRQLLSLEETHNICEKYLLQYDYACADMFEQIRCLMPRETNGRQYVAT